MPTRWCQTCLSRSVPSYVRSPLVEEKSAGEPGRELRGDPKVDGFATIPAGRLIEDIDRDPDARRPMTSPSMIAPFSGARELRR
jgi:hypothetical protein